MSRCSSLSSDRAIASSTVASPLAISPAHHIPKQRHRMTNWAAYDVALRQRGSLTVWFTDAAIAAWKAEPRATRGGQPRYSALAITTALTLRAVFRLALRQDRRADRIPSSAA